MSLRERLVNVRRALQAREGFASMTFAALMMPVLVVFALQYVVLQGMLLMVQRESYSAVYDAERVGVLDIDPVAYVSGVRGLDKAQALSDIQAALPVNLTNVVGLTSNTLTVAAANPGEIDPFTGATAANPLVHVQGVVNTSLVGASYPIWVDAIYQVRRN